MRVAGRQRKLQGQHHLFLVRLLAKHLHRLRLHLDRGHAGDLFRNAVHVLVTHQLHHLCVCSRLRLVHRRSLQRLRVFVQLPHHQRRVRQADGLHVDGVQLFVLQRYRV